MDDSIQAKISANILEVLSRLNNEMLYIHKIQLKTKLPKNYYNELPIITSKKRNHGKILKNIIGSNNVKYVFYSNGTINIYIECSKNPFKLQKDEDVNI